MATHTQPGFALAHIFITTALSAVLIIGLWLLFGASKVSANSTLPEIISPEVCDLEASQATSQSFSWTANETNVVSWQIKAGSFAGSGDYFTSPFLDPAVTNYSVSGFPVDGSTAYVSLWYSDGIQPWQYIVFECQTMTFEDPELTSPDVNNCVFNSASHVFEWTTENTGVDLWLLMLGSQQGGSDIYFSGALNADVGSITANNLPTDGSAVYLRLLYHRAETNSWTSILAECTASNAAPAGDPYLESHPTAGCVFDGVDELVQWSDNGSTVDNYWLYVGSFKGWYDLHNSSALGSVNSHMLTSMPEDGRTIHMRLWFNIAGSWSYIDQECQSWTAPPSELPEFTSHSAVGCNTVSDDLFEWTYGDNSIGTFWLYAGSNKGWANYHNSGMLQNQFSQSVSNLPSDGSTVHLRLWYLKNNSWQYIDQSCVSS